jgi:membrane associated rhomboid family serine protease
LLGLQENEQLEIYRSLRFPILFVIILWVVKIVEQISESDFSSYGLVPLNFTGVRGIIFSPLIHGNWQHLINNTIPIFVLTWTLFYFYRNIAFKVFFLVYFIHGIWLWFMGRITYHIGASGIIYGLGTFIFVSGIIRKNSHLLAISLLVAFLYGSMIWGIFPIEEYISWEGHLTGLVAGLILAFYYKNYGPSANFGQQKDLTEEYSEDEEVTDQDEYWNSPDLENKEEI